MHIFAAVIQKLPAEDVQTYATTPNISVCMSWPFNFLESRNHWIWLLKQREEMLHHTLAFSGGKKNPANGKCLTMFAFVFSLACSAELNLLFAIRQKAGQITCLPTPIQRKGTMVSESAMENGAIFLTLYKYLSCRHLSCRNNKPSWNCLFPKNLKRLKKTPNTSFHLSCKYFQERFNLQKKSVILTIAVLCLGSFDERMKKVGKSTIFFNF